MKKIDILVHTLNHSGAVHAAIVQANGFAAHSFDVKLIIADKKKESPYAIDDRVEVVFLGVNKSSGLFGKITYITSAFFNIAKYLIKYKPQNLFVWGKEYSCVAIFLSKLLRSKVKIVMISAISVRGNLKYDKNSFQSFLHKAVYKNLFAKSHHIICQTDGMVAELVEDFDLDKNNISVAYPALSKKFFDNFGVRTSAKEKKVIFVGRLSKQKNPHAMIEIFANLAQRYDDIKLVFLGDGELKEDLKKTAELMNVADKIEFAGAKNDVRGDILSAYVLALTSEYEGFGMVLAEAMALGVPAVAFNCPVGPSDIIIEEKNGYLIDNYDKTKFSQALESALNKKWDEAEIKKSVQKFHPDSVIKKYIDVAEKVFN